MSLRPSPRRAVLGAAGLGTVLIGLAAAASPPLRLVYNGTQSVPIGWYVAVQTDRYERGELVLAEPPEAFGRLIARRGYLPPDVPLIKRVAALPGDRVCYRDGVLTVTLQGQERPTVTVEPAPLDRLGRVMPHWNECRTLAAGEVFLLLSDTDASLDSRYFGPVPTSSVRGKLRRVKWP
jgi:conjugative transfer signal peptidase TraF